MSSAQIVPVGSVTVELIRGDPAAQQTEVLLTAVSGLLEPFGPADRAIRAVGGPAIAAELAVRAGQAGHAIVEGDVLRTEPGRLRVGTLMHVVVAEWRPDRRVACLTLLHEGVCRALRWAAEIGCASVGLPALGVGPSGYPAPEAAEPTVAAVRATLSDAAAAGSIRRVVWVFYDDTILAAFAAELRRTEPSSASLDAAPTEPNVSDRTAPTGPSCPNPICRVALSREAVFCPRCGRKLPSFGTWRGRRR